jgi:hypothetical protein
MPCHEGITTKSIEQARTSMSARITEDVVSKLVDSVLAKTWGKTQVGA